MKGGLMPRTVNEQAHAERRNQILDVAQRLIYTKGYEQMSIQDILDELNISKGAFYHYFDGKSDLLEALVDRIIDAANQVLIPIVEDPDLSALDKLQRYFDVAVRWKTTRREFLIRLLRVWYSDHNAIVRQKIWRTRMREAIAPFVAILQQGIREGTLDIPHPEEIGPMVMALFQSLGDALAELLLAEPPPEDALQQAARILDAYNGALERLLGAPAGAIRLMDATVLQAWFDTLEAQHALAEAAEAGPA
jgi:AcrR family transcriptional regulator